MSVVLLIAAAVAGEPMAVRVDGCPARMAGELRRIVAVEMIGEPIERVRDTTATVTCGARGIRLRVRTAGRAVVTRTLGIDAGGERERLVALALVELLRGEARVPDATVKKPRGEPEPVWRTPMIDRILTTSVIATVSLAVVPGFAAGKTEVEVPAPQTAVTKPAVKAQSGARPTLVADDPFAGKGEKIRAVTGEQIKVLDRLIAATADRDPELASLWFQRGDLQAELSRYHNFRARGLDAHLKQPGAKDEQTDHEARERAALLEAVKSYLVVAERPEAWRGFARMDELLLHLAYLLDHSGKGDAARGYYRRIIKDHPTSRFIPDALLSFAEKAFSERDFETALKLFDKILEHPGSRLRGYALYKKAWCLYDTGDLKAAIVTFADVIALARGKKDALALEREARRDLVRVYARIGGADRALAYFQRVAPPHAMVMLEQLAELMQGEGRFADSVRLYRELMAGAPSSSKLCGWQREVVRGVLGLSGARADAATVTELERLALLSDRAAGDRECKEGLAALLVELGPVWHREAQATANTRSFELAHALYQLTLQRFAQAPNSQSVAFYDGELLYRLERWCEAAPRYDEVAHKGGRYRREAAWAAVLSWKQCLKIDDVPRLTQAPGRALEPRPMPSEWRRMFEAFDRYLSHVPDSAERALVLYRKARVLYELNQFAEAAPLFREVLDKHRAADVAVYAADLLFDCLAALQRTDALAEAVERYGTFAELRRSEGFVHRCDAIRAALGRERAEAHARAGRHAEAGEAYRQLAERFPDDPRLDEILYNVAVELRHARLVGGAIGALRMLVERRPSSPLAKKALFMIGRSYQDIAAYEQAAENYEDFAQRFPTDGDSGPALLRAAFFRRGLGQSDRALADSARYLRTRGRGDDPQVAAGVAFAEAQIFEQQGDRARLEKHLEEWLRTFGAKGGADRQVIAHAKLAELAWRAACPVEPVNGVCLETRRHAPALRDHKVSPPGPEARLAAQGSASCGKGVPQVVRERDARLSARALSHAAEAIKLTSGARELRVKDESERTQRQAELAYHAALAKMIESDRAFEHFASLPVPPSLDLTRPADKRALGRWFDEKRRRMEDVRKRYEGVILTKQAHFAIAASARIGQAFQAFARQLSTTPIPPAPRPPAGVSAKKWAQMFEDAYCTAFDEQIIALEDKATHALGRCLDKSVDLSWFNEWSSLCEGELNALRPREYPLAAELRAQPGYASIGTRR